MKEFLAASRPHAAWIGNPSLGSTGETLFLSQNCKKGLERAQRKSKSKENHFRSSQRVRSRRPLSRMALDTHIVVSVFSFTE